MTKPRASGLTFAPEDLYGIDFECVSQIPISVGTDRYSKDPSTKTCVLAFKPGGQPTGVTAVDTLSRPLDWAEMPAGLHEAYDRVVQGEAMFFAHSAGFDRHLWNHATTNFPPLKIEHIVCSRVQAITCGLPPDLARAAKYVGAAEKLESGKALIKLFCVPGAIGQIETHPDEWQQFLEYARADVEAMHGLFHRTRQLPLREWQQYWCFERINDVGMHVDLDLAKAAADMAVIDKSIAAKELQALTGGIVTAVTQVPAMRRWLLDILPSEGRDILIRRVEEVDPDTGEVTKPQKTSLKRVRIERLLAYLGSQTPLTPPLAAAQRLLQIRHFGGSMTPGKFQKILDHQVNGVLRGQYWFNGAPQTGRASSRGVQIHNLARDPLDYELEAINALLAGIGPEAFAKLGDDTPISRKLSLLIRPTFIADPDNALVWGDWANIEARLLPWLSKDPEAEKRLDLFRAVDDGREKYDIYTRTAASITGLPLAEAKEKKPRQVGKVTELAAGFGGARGALLSMAAGFGIHMTEAEADAIIKKWRAENRWAVRFWGGHTSDADSFGLWGAVRRAINRPGTEIHVGRVTYCFASGMLDGTLYCRLPSGRLISYRKCRMERYAEKDEDTGEIISISTELMFSRDSGRLKMWPGLLCENIVQATAADILRETLVRLEDLGIVARGHTHDEVLLECHERHAEDVAKLLQQVMERGFEWSGGLPIKADTSIARWYTKAEESIGL